MAKGVRMVHLESKAQEVSTLLDGDYFIDNMGSSRWALCKASDNKPYRTDYRVSPLMPKAELYDWLDGYIDGIRSGRER